jgi:hypothetical protein
MGHAAGHPRLAQQALGVQGIAGQLGAQELQRDAPPEREIAGLVDDPMPPRPTQRTTS